MNSTSMKRLIAVPLYLLTEEELIDLMERAQETQMAMVRDGEEPPEELDGLQRSIMMALECRGHFGGDVLDEDWDEEVTLQ